MKKSDYNKNEQEMMTSGLKMSIKTADEYNKELEQKLENTTDDGAEIIKVTTTLDLTDGADEITEKIEKIVSSEFIDDLGEANKVDEVVQQDTTDQKELDIASDEIIYEIADDDEIIYQSKALQKEPVEETKVPSFTTSGLNIPQEPTKDLKEIESSIDDILGRNNVDKNKHINEDLIKNFVSDEEKTAEDEADKVSEETKAALLVDDNYKEDLLNNEFINPAAAGVSQDIESQGETKAEEPAKAKSAEDVLSRFSESTKPAEYFDSEIYSKKVGTTSASRKPMRRSTVFLVLASMVLLGLAIGGSFALVMHHFPAKTIAVNYNKVEGGEVVKRSEDEENAINKVARKYMPAVVKIEGKVKPKNPFFSNGSAGVSGTGVVFSVDDTEIFIITNKHVISSIVGKPTVKFDEDNKVRGKVIGSDDLSDLAVIKVKKIELTNEFIETLVPVTMADSDSLQIGDKTIAIGNPLGYEDTVTSGCVSGLNRRIVSESSDLTLIQTDAAINSGNSGGALFNDKGELIGINTIKIKETGVEGLGFAIPTNEVSAVIEQIMQKGFVERPYIGIRGGTVSDIARKQYGWPRGVLVDGIERDTPAFYSNLKRGDIIVMIDKQEVNTMEDLAKYIRKKHVGDFVFIHVVRNNLNKSIKLKLMQRPIVENE